MEARSASFMFWRNKYELLGRIREEASTSKESDAVDSGSASDQEKPSTSEESKAVDSGSVPVQQEPSTSEKGNGLDFGGVPDPEAPSTSEKREGVDFGTVIDRFDLLKNQGCGAQAGVRALLVLANMSKR